MKLDKDKLCRMLAEDDETLWREIRSIAKGHGLNLPDTPPPHSEMERLRSTVGDGSRINLTDAIKIINSYKRGAKK